MVGRSSGLTLWMEPMRLTFRHGRMATVLLTTAIGIGSAGCATGAGQSRPSTPYKGNAVWDISSAAPVPVAAATPRR